MRYLSADEIFTIHQTALRKSSGAAGVRDAGLLLSIAEKPKAAFGGTELYPGIFMKAAVLLEAIAQYHVFTDANKRTAWMSAHVFLLVNGYRLRATTATVFRFLLRIAEKKISASDAARWLEKHSVKI